MYVVAYHADQSLNITAVGPFRSYRRANGAVTQIEKDMPEVIAQVCELRSWITYLSSPSDANQQLGGDP